MTARRAAAVSPVSPASPVSPVSGVRPDVVDAMVARAKRMSAAGCGSVRNIAEGTVTWHLSNGAITAAEAAAVLSAVSRG